MSGITKIDIHESEQNLRLLLSQQKTPEQFQKVQVLYLLKSQQVKTVKQLAELIGRHRITVQGWLRTYREGGLEELLGEKLPGGRKSSIPPWAIAQLTAKLEESPTFSTYREIQAWLELELEIKVSYDVVYYLVHDKLKISLAKTRDK